MIKLIISAVVGFFIASGSVKSQVAQGEQSPNAIGLWIGGTIVTFIVLSIIGAVIGG